MSITREGDIVRLCGRCEADAAEQLLTFVQAGLAVDVTEADHLHTAVLQILFGLQPRVIGPARDPFIARWLGPLLIAAQAGGEPEPA